jgi:hypothetical protein
MLGAAFFFAVTLFISFFLVIVSINKLDLPKEFALNIFMLGLVPPSILTVILFTRVLGRFSFKSEGEPPGNTLKAL